MSVRVWRRCGETEGGVWGDRTGQGNGGKGEVRGGERGVV